jgi:hypothetical protein
MFDIIKKPKKFKSNLDFYNKFLDDLFGENGELFDSKVDITVDYKKYTTYDINKLILTRHRKKTRYSCLTGGCDDQKRYYYWVTTEQYDVVDLFNHFHTDFPKINKKKWKSYDKAKILFDMVDFQLDPNKWLLEAVKEMKIRHGEIEKIWNLV